MTIVPIWRRCPKCHRRYSWNPDVGHFNCPFCYGMENLDEGLVTRIFGKKFGLTDDELGETKDSLGEK
ncbi:MAG: hypothetical protein Q4E17_01205 [Synergistes sp.]|nr:hypothetical protein [Synergistes sp.]